MKAFPLTCCLLIGLVVGYMIGDALAPDPLGFWAEQSKKQAEVWNLEAENKKSLGRIHDLEEQIEVTKIAALELSKFIRATDRFILEHPEIADDFPKHPFRVETKDEDEELLWKQ